MWDKDCKSAQLTKNRFQFSPDLEISITGGKERVKEKERKKEREGERESVFLFVWVFMSVCALVKEWECVWWVCVCGQKLWGKWRKNDKKINKRNYLTFLPRIKRKDKISSFIKNISEAKLFCWDEKLNKHFLS